MRPFVKMISIRNPIARELRETHGDEAFTYLAGLIELVHEIGVFELTPKILSGEFGLKAPKINRIINDLAKALHDSLLFLGILKKTENNSSKLEITQENSKSEGQNPHGSTRDQEENRLENREEIATPQALKNSVELANGYAKSSPNHSAPHWVEGYLRDYYVLNRGKWSALSDDDIYTCWANACGKWDKGQAYVKQVFKSELEGFDPSKRPKIPVSKPPTVTRGELLMTAKRIRNRFEPIEYDTSELTIDRFKQVWHGADMLDVNEFDPVGVA